MSSINNTLIHSSNNVSDDQDRKTVDFSAFFVNNTARIAEAIKKLGKQIHPDNRYLSSSVTFITNILATLANSLAIPPTSITTQFLSRVQSVLAGELYIMAKKEAERSHKKFDDARPGCYSLIINDKKFEEYFPSGWFPVKVRIHDYPSECAHLVLPVPTDNQCSTMHYSVRIMFTSVLEYFAAELLEPSGNACRDRQSLNVTIGDICTAIRADRELLQTMANIHFEPITPLSFNNNSVNKSYMLGLHYEKSQNLMKQLIADYAWFNQGEATINYVLNQFLSQQIHSGDSYFYQTYHIRPVQYYGRSKYAVLHSPVFQDDDDDDDEIEPSNDFDPFICIAFDLMDAENNEFPFILEYRYKKHDDDNPGEGSLLRRSDYRLVADALPCELGSIFDFVIIQKKFVKHNISFDYKEFDRIVAGIIDTDTAVYVGYRMDFEYGQECEFYDDHSIDYQIQALCCIASKLMKFEPTQATLFQNNIPSSIVRLFSNQVIKSGFDENKISFPYDLIDIIGSYCPVDLPFIPLRSDKQYLPNQVGQDSNLNNNEVDVDDMEVEVAPVKPNTFYCNNTQVDFTKIIAD